MSRKNTGFRLLRLPLLKSAFYAAIAFAVDTVALLALTGGISPATLTLVTFLEGGVGLLVGVGISLSSTPSISSTGEALFGTSPWTRQSEKNAERVGLRWIAASAILVMLGVLVSAL